LASLTSSLMYFQHNFLWLMRRVELFRYISQRNEENRIQSTTTTTTIPIFPDESPHTHITERERDEILCAPLSVYVCVCLYAYKIPLLLVDGNKKHMMPLPGVHWRLHLLKSQLVHEQQRGKEKTRERCKSNGSTLRQHMRLLNSYDADAYWNADAVYQQKKKLDCILDRLLTNNNDDCLRTCV